MFKDILTWQRNGVGRAQFRLGPFSCHLTLRGGANRKVRRHFLVSLLRHVQPLLAEWNSHYWLYQSESRHWGPAETKHWSEGLGQGVLTSEPHPTLGYRIRTRRLEIGLRQADLAQQLGVERTHISRLEHGHHKPSPALKMKLEHQPQLNWYQRNFIKFQGWDIASSIRAAKLKLKVAEISADEPKRIGGVRKLSIVKHGSAGLLEILYEYWLGKNFY